MQTAKFKYFLILTGPIRTCRGRKNKIARKKEKVGISIKKEITVSSVLESKRLAGTLKLVRMLRAIEIYVTLLDFCGLDMLRRCKEVINASI
jgi:hypothetical protein